MRYRVIDCHEDRPAGCDESQVFNITKYDPSGTIEIPKLRKFTSYSISVQVFNSKGKGVLSKTVNVTTAEDSKCDHIFVSFFRCPRVFPMLHPIYTMPDEYLYGWIFVQKAFPSTQDLPILMEINMAIRINFLFPPKTY